MDRVIFQASDLAKDRTKFLDAARTGRALVRDKDGTGLVMLPEAELEVLEGYARWSQVHQRISSFLESKREITVSELGDMAWLRVFDRDDIAMFASELHESLVAGLSDLDLSATAETIAAWRTTSRQLEDPLRRSVLVGAKDPSDFVEAARPDE
jgi:hypothetical protein